MASPNLRDTVNEFNDAIDEFTDTLVPAQIDILMRKLGLQALRGIVLKTPVDTGRARGGWQVTLNQLAPPDNETGVTDQSGSTAINNGSAKINGGKGIGIIWISNNVHYIIYLENGTSKQARNGMVALTVQELQTQFP